MFRSGQVLLGLVVVFGASVILPSPVQQPADDSGSESPRLPGAMAEINAGDFASIQAAIDALPDSGGIVRIPAGTFELSEPLRITGEDVHLTGAGSSTHLKNINEDGQPTIALLPPEPYDRSNPTRNRVNRWRIQVSNLRLTGNDKSGPGIDALWVNEIFLHGITVSYHGGDGIRLDHCYEDPRICDCLITYNKGTGVKLLGCHDIVVSANQFEENQDALHCFDGFNLCMNGNNLDDHLGDGVVIENTYGSVLSGNMIEECAGWAVVMDRDCYGNTVSANVIAHNGGGIDLRDAHGCAISANTLTIMKTHALRIAESSGRITVTGNNFSNSYVGDDKVRRGTEDLAAAGLTLLSSDSISITGNVFSGLTTEAVSVDSSTTGSVFAGNVLKDVESQHQKLEGSSIEANVEN